MERALSERVEKSGLQVDAALAAGIFHEGLITVSAVKQYLAELGIPVRTSETITPTS